MSYQVERDGLAVAVLVAQNPAALWTVVGSNAALGDVLAGLERNFPEREVSRNLSTPELELAGRMASEFLAVAEAEDPGLRFNFTARVPLSIPDWDEIQNLFRLRVLAKTRPETPVVLWLADPSLVPLLEGAGITSSGYSTNLRPIRFALRAFRSLLRCLLLRRPHVAACYRLWISPGHWLAADSADTYFGHWWRQTPGKNFRVFMAPGNDLCLGQDASQAPLEAFCSCNDVLGAIQECMRPPVAPSTITADSDRALWLWLAGAEWARGDTYALALIRRVMQRILRQVQPESLVLPFEGRAWERSVNRLAREQGCRVIGYQHSSLTPRHLALLQPGRGWCYPDIPDRVVTCGAITAERLSPLVAASGATVFAGAALRAQRQPLPAPGKALLVAISSSLGEARAMLQFVHGAAQRLDVPIIIRTHPIIPVDDLFRRFRWSPLVELSLGYSLAEDIERAGFVAYSSSTVALEGLIHGRLPVFLDIRDILSGDPIDDGEFKLRAANPDELVSCLKCVLSWPVERLERVRGLGRAYVERYLAAPSADKLALMNAALLP